MLRVQVGKVSRVMLTRRAGLDGTRRELVALVIAADGFPDVTTFLLLVAARVIAAIIGPISRISRPLAASSAASAVLVVVFLITFVAAGQLMRRFQGLPVHTCDGEKANESFLCPHLELHYHLSILI